MEVKTQGKFIRISPIKARSVANLVRGKKALPAMTELKFMPQSAAKILGKVIKTAVSDAENNYSLDKNDLVISQITVDKGPSFKRIQPVAKGMAHPIEKKTSHITVVVSGETKIERLKVQKPAKEEKENIEEVKVERQGAFSPDRKSVV